MRILLLAAALILVCWLALPSYSTAPPLAAVEVDRYQIVEADTTVYLLDSISGRTWHMESMHGLPRWREIGP